MRERKPWIAHPILMALYPAVALLASNRTQVKFEVGTRALAFSLILGLIIWLVARLIVKDLQKSALLTTFILALAFSYGHVYAMLKQTTLAGHLIGRHRYLAPVWAVILMGGAWWILRRGRRPRQATLVMNWILFVALVIPLVQIVVFTVRLHRTGAERVDRPEVAAGVSLEPPSGELPDIYYIIVDGYTRADTLREVFDFDNQPFLDWLRATGFFVAECSQSNYAQTELSLASSLNFDYLDALGDGFVPESTDRAPLWPLIEKSAVRAILEGLGYKVVAFETGYYWTQLEDADIYLKPAMSTLQSWSAFGGLNDFEVMLFKSSIGILIADGVMVLPSAFQPNLNYPDQVHRERVQFTLAELEKLPAIPGPKFAFVHVVAPHFPYVFGPDGEQIVASPSRDAQERQAQDLAGYRDQVIFLNKQLERILERLIQDSDVEPVIILQGDHGPGLVPEPLFSEHRMNILNAYYLPASPESGLYAGITPVNTFRMVLDRVFGADLALLEDLSRLSAYERPYDYTVVPNNCVP